MAIELRKSTTRWVVMTRRYALKLPSLSSYKQFLWGLSANIREVEWTGYSHKFCPVLFRLPLGLLVVMPRCEPFHGRVDPREFDGLPIDPGPQNFGFYQGRLVSFDYGR